MDPDAAIDLFVDAVKDGEAAIKYRNEHEMYDPDIDARIIDAGEEALEHFENVNAWISRGGFRPKKLAKFQKWTNRFSSLSETAGMLEGTL